MAEMLFHDLPCLWFSEVMMMTFFNRNKTKKSFVSERLVKSETAQMVSPSALEDYPETTVHGMEVP